MIRSSCLLASMVNLAKSYLFTLGGHIMEERHTLARVHHLIIAHYVLKFTSCIDTFGRRIINNNCNIICAGHVAGHVA